MPSHSESRGPKSLEAYVMSDRGAIYVLGVERHWTERVCGHELLQWVEQLFTAIFPEPVKAE